MDRLFEAASRAPAVVPGIPVRFTVKEMNDAAYVKQTLDRRQVWEIQTPQLVKRSVLESGFDLAEKKKIDVTDDVGFAELLGVPVLGVEGLVENIKVTVSQDLEIVSRYLTNV